MKLNIRGNQIEVTEALRDYVDKKLSKLNKHFDTPPASTAQVTLNVIKDKQIVEVTIPLPGVILRAEERHEDMYAAIDLVSDKLERQIRKHKTKMNRKIRQKGGMKDLFRTDTATISSAEEEELEVVRTKRFNLKPMDVDEAIMQMDMIGHDFFVFSNMDTNEVNVVYKRNDGKYGLIEPAN